MADTLVRCPACRAGIKVKIIPLDKKSFPCPKCRGRVPYPKPEEEEELEVEAADEEEDEEPVAPRRQKTRRKDDDDEDNRPRKRKKRKPAEPVDNPLMWPVGLAGAVIVAVVVVGLFYALNGPDGFPEPQEGPPIIKPIVLGFFVILGAVIAVYGTLAMVTQQVTLSKRFLFVKVYEETHQGTWAIVIGAIQCVLGGFIAGTGLYGIIF